MAYSVCVCVFSLFKLFFYSFISFFIAITSINHRNSKFYCLYKMRCAFLKLNLKHCSTSTKEKAYKFLIQPTVEYCSSVWDCYTAKNMKKVEMVQRRAAHWILSRYNRQDSVTDMLNELGWKSLQSRRISARLSMLYKFRNNLANVDNANLHQITYSSTRSSGHAYMTINAKCDFYKYSFFSKNHTGMK